VAPKDSGFNSSLDISFKVGVDTGFRSGMFVAFAEVMVPDTTGSLV
jgi:hypothetical protein